MFLVYDKEKIIEAKEIRIQYTRYLKDNDSTLKTEDIKQTRKLERLVNDTLNNDTFVLCSLIDSKNNDIDFDYIYIQYIDFQKDNTRIFLENEMK